MDSAIDQHVIECCVILRASDWPIKDQCNVPQKFMTLEAIHIAQKKPLLNTRDEYRRQELALIYLSTAVLLLNWKITFFESKH